MKKLLFIYNPNAGKGQIKMKIAEIIDIFVKADYIPTVYATQAARDGYRMLIDNEEQYDLIVCSGGDGTLDEVVTAMIVRGMDCSLGYIPAGSTNDFARSLKISRNMIKAAEDAVHGRVFPCDVGSFNGGVFVYIAAFGMFTDVSYATSQDIKNVLGHMAYVLEGIKRIYNIPAYQMKITCDDGEIKEGTYMYGMVTNSSSVGGFKSIIGKNVIFDDGEFEVTLIRKPQNIIELQEIVAALIIEQINSKYMESFKAKSIVFESQDEVAWTLDGEFGGNHKKVTIENLNQELNIVLPLENDMEDILIETFEDEEWTEDMIETYMLEYMEQIQRVQSDEEISANDDEIMLE
ncbi:MAG: YegS/Rv2252/BmrU family lipid kinase [Eubacteriales bacterium]